MTASAAAAALYLSLKWRDKSNLTPVRGRSVECRRQKEAIRNSVDKRTETAGRSEVPISPTRFLSKCTTMHNALLGVGKRKRALGIHGMRCSYNNFDKMRMEEEGAFAL